MFGNVWGLTQLKIFSRLSIACFVLTYSRLYRDVAVKATTFYREGIPIFAVHFQTYLISEHVANLVEFHSVTSMSKHADN